MPLKMKKHEKMENLLTEESLYDMHFEPNNEKYSNHNLTMEDIKTILDLPADAMKGIREDKTHEKPLHLLQDIEHMGITEKIEIQPGDEEKVIFESISSYTSESSDTPAHIAHGVINFNINKMLDWSVDVNKQEDLNSRSSSIFLEESPINKFGLNVYNGQNLFQNLKTESEEKPPIEHLSKSLVAKYSCDVCTKPALKYSSYGGKACSSCRSFFRRSSQSNYHTVYHCKSNENCVMDPSSRKNCQYCRFQTCLRSGMRITWVLSDEERKRRFGKEKKTYLEIIKSELGETIFSPARKPNLYLSFTIEEQNILEDTHSKFQVPWLQNFLLFNRDAAKNLIEFTYGMTNLKKNTWHNLAESMHFNFTRYILPKFTELSNLPSSDFGQIMNSASSGIELFFRGCFAITMDKSVYGKPYNCPVALQVKSVANNADLVSSLDLSDLLSGLGLSDDDKDMRAASYDELYPQHWAGDSRKEERHRNIVKRIIAWPKTETNAFDFSLVTLMSLILALNVDFYPLVRRDIMEKIQLKYITILQRYLRSKLEIKTANKKFLEAMMLIADTREAWEMSNGPIENY